VRAQPAAAVRLSFPLPAEIPVDERPTTPRAVPRSTRKRWQLRLHGHNRWLWSALGSLMVASVVVSALTFATESHTARGPHASSLEVASAPGHEVVGILAESARTAETTAAPMTLAELDAECRSYLARRTWAELERCADQLEPLAPKRAAELKTRATEELKAIPRLAAAEAALLAKDLRRAQAQLASVWSESVEYASIKRKYDLSEARAIAELASQLERVKAPDCKAYEALLAKERSTKPPRVTDEAARRATCAPVVCTGDAFAERGQDLFSSGHLAEALESYETAYGCRTVWQWAEKAFLIACRLPDPEKAKLYWKRLLPVRSRALEICLHNGITEAMLNAR
jgi:hypothetical protein